MANKMWKDSEADLDFLNFNYLAEQVVEIAKDEELSPATIGVYGDWGSGKSSLMKMVKKTLDSDKKTLTVEFKKEHRDGSVFHENWMDKTDCFPLGGVFKTR